MRYFYLQKISLRIFCALFYLVCKTNFSFHLICLWRHTYVNIEHAYLFGIYYGCRAISAHSVILHRKNAHFKHGYGVTCCRNETVTLLLQQITFMFGVEALIYFHYENFASNDRSTSTFNLVNKPRASN